MTRRRRFLGAAITIVLSLLVTYLFDVTLPALGAGGLLHPSRRLVEAPTPDGCQDAAFAGAGVTLRGWQCTATGARRGTVIYLHGIADNRAGSVGVIDRFRRKGFDVVAYDSRAHGASGGDACTYGYFEKDDLRRVIDILPTGPVVLIGQSLGAAVALQEAATDSRVQAIVAAETFSSLRDIVRDRAPFFFTSRTIDRGLAVAERAAGLRVNEVDPAGAAQRIAVPVLLIHGSADVDTPPAHSERVYQRLAGKKRLLLVPGAHHNESMRSDEVWRQVDTWIEPSSHGTTPQ